MSQSGWTLRRMIPVAVIVAGMLAVQYWGWIAYRDQRPTFIEFGEVQVAEGAQTPGVCPGDEVHTVVPIRVGRAMIIDWGVQIWAVGATEPALPIQFDKTVRAVTSEPITVTRSWIVPQLPPGLYERHTVFAPASMASQPASFVIPFTIRGDCQ